MEGGIGLNVEFRFRGDRFTHLISLVAAEKSIPLLESVEGTAAESWPASPPLQGLHIEALPDGRSAALLVGAAGRAHWSASIEASPTSALTYKAAALVFDIACRTEAPSARLGTTYRQLPTTLGKLAAGNDGSWVEFQYGNVVVLIIPSRERDTQSAVALLDPVNFAVTPETQLAGTTRWRYRLESHRLR
jgi:hypothetical protein